MLRINHCKSSDQAKTYYNKGDYYTQGSNGAGEWTGKGAVLLGLKGPVNVKDFEALCDNHHPQTGERITPKTKRDRRPAYDFTFSLWKSASVIQALGGDDRILPIFQAAVNDTTLVMEPYMEARVRMGDADYDRVTGNLVAAPFLHTVTRPVDGVPDPHLHMHMVVLNMTYDQVEQKWKAGQFGRIKEMGDYFEELFDGKLAVGLRSLGYRVERRGKNKDYEIAGVPDSVVRKFSRRTEEIEKKAKQLGITDPEQKASLGKSTRKGKRHDLSEAELKQNWRSRLSEDEFAELGSVVNSAFARGVIELQCHPTAREMIDYAIRHIFERCSVVKEHQLLSIALEQGTGGVALEELKAVLDATGVIREETGGKVYVTTQKVLDEEFENVRFYKLTRGTLQPIRMVTENPNSRLSSEQWHAFKHVLESRDRVVAIAGSPGSGKTTVMTPIIRSIEARGIRVFTFAPSAEASRKVLRDEGFANADTLRRFLIDPNLQKQASGQVVWIDEAGLIGAADMHALFTLSQKYNFRIVLSGDIGQHGPVARGDALRLLIDHAGLKPAAVRTVRRQKRETYRKAVQLIADKNLKTGYDMLDKMGGIEEISDDKLRLKKLAQCYLKLSTEQNRCLVISPTHAEGKLVTALIRRKLKKACKLSKNQRPVRQFANLRWTEAQRANPTLYQAGMVIQFHQNPPGGKISRGDRFTVTSVSGESIIMRSSSGKCLTLPLNSAPSFTVYESRTIFISAGESIRLTSNGMSKNGRRIENGTIRVIEKFTTHGEMICTDGTILSPDHGHLAYGYCTTSMSSQGKTVDHVIIAQSAESLGRASSLEQFNVSVSRGKESVHIFTDDKEALFQAVSRSSARVSAHDLLNQKRRRQLLRNTIRRSTLLHLKQKPVCVQSPSPVLATISSPQTNEPSEIDIDL
jgi:conjugative relaxase-like TrwC/TraI family protein